MVGQSDIEVFPESETQFFMKVLPVQVTFVRDAHGVVSSLIHHQGGAEIPALRRIIAEHVRGEPDFDNMSPALAALAREQFEMIQADLAKAGAPIRANSVAAPATVAPISAQDATG